MRRKTPEPASVVSTGWVTPARSAACRRDASRAACRDLSGATPRDRIGVDHFDFPEPGRARQGGFAAPVGAGDHIKRRRRRTCRVAGSGGFPVAVSGGHNTGAVRPDATKRSPGRKPEREVRLDPFVPILGTTRYPGRRLRSFPSLAQFADHKSDLRLDQFAVAKEPGHAHDGSVPVRTLSRFVRVRVGDDSGTAAPPGRHEGAGTPGGIDPPVGAPLVGARVGRRKG